MPESALKSSQLKMARYLRDPRRCPPPAGVEPRRLKVYEDLIYNNIEGFISSGFPVLRSLYSDDDWHALVRLFMDQHRCHTPYFLEISQEFLHFLMRNFVSRSCDPPFIAELAHYEWAELALDTSPEELPEQCVVSNVLEATPQLSPLAWLLSYQWPVHLIGASFRPREIVGPTYLVVYRNRQDKVKFMALNATTARLLEKIRDNQQRTAHSLLQGLAKELGMQPASLCAAGSEQLQEFIALSVVLVSSP